MARTKDRYTVRWIAGKRDLTQMADIERTTPEAWDKEMLAKFLGQRQVISLVVENEHGHIIGYAAYRLQRYAIELLKMAVHPCDRRQGIGSMMLDRLKDRLGVRRWRLIRHEHESNLDAQLFLQSQGFRATSVLHDWFDDGASAYCMIYFGHRPEQR